MPSRSQIAFAATTPVTHERSWLRPLLPCRRPGEKESEVRSENDSEEGETYL